jgi:hypothetical protein
LPKEEHMAVSAPAFLANIWPSVGTIVFQDVHMRYKYVSSQLAATPS